MHGLPSQCKSEGSPGHGQTGEGNFGEGLARLSVNRVIDVGPLSIMIDIHITCLIHLNYCREKACRPHIGYTEKLGIQNHCRSLNCKMAFDLFLSVYLVMFFKRLGSLYIQKEIKIQLSNVCTVFITFYVKSYVSFSWKGKAVRTCWRGGGIFCIKTSESVVVTFQKKSILYIYDF